MAVKLCLRAQEDGTLAREILFRQRACLAAALRQTRFDFIFDSEIAAVGMPQKDQPHYRQEILVTGIVTVRP